MDEITVRDNALPFDETISKRVVAEAIRRVGLSTVTMYSMSKKMSYYDALANMIWQGVVEGEITFANGETFKIPDLKEGPKIWMDMVRFIAQHLDGGVGINTQVNTLNVFKVYQGIDPDQV